MEERPVSLLIVLLFYFLAAANLLLGVAIGVLTGDAVGPLVLPAIVGAFTCVFAFAAWKHHRWGYFGVIFAGLWFVLRKAQVAHGLGWSDTHLNIEIALISLPLTAFLIHRRVFLTRNSAPETQHR
jgi:hypothetical protein